jgi:hypothetical protein
VKPAAFVVSVSVAGIQQSLPKRGLCCLGHCSVVTGLREQLFRVHHVENFTMLVDRIAT